MTDITCPICRGSVLSRGEGKLEQSGDSYLPTIVWSCAICEYRHYEPATGTHWQSAAAPPAASPVAAPARRRAA